jgi:hypothetical protein
MIALYCIGVYLGLGFAFALIFVTKLVDKIDSSAVGAPWTFKAIILPGCVVFWPVLLHKYVNQKNRNG